jgi:hypothetical protein
MASLRASGLLVNLAILPMVGVAQEQRTVTFAPSDTITINPGKGWVLNGRPGDGFSPEVLATAAVALRVCFERGKPSYVQLGAYGTDGKDS